jgi:hypothetical protein
MSILVMIVSGLLTVLLVGPLMLLLAWILTEWLIQ